VARVDGKGLFRQRQRRARIAGVQLLTQEPLHTDKAGAIVGQQRLIMLFGAFGIARDLRSLRVDQCGQLGTADVFIRLGRLCHGRFTVARRQCD